MNDPRRHYAYELLWASHEELLALLEETLRLRLLPRGLGIRISRAVELGRKVHALRAPAPPATPESYPVTSSE